MLPTSRDRRHIETHALILDGQHDASIGPLQSSQGPIDPGMFGHVVQTFLNDAEKSFFLLSAHAGIPVDVQFNHQSIPLL